jgi:predicted nucleotidyltransferase
MLQKLFSSKVRVELLGAFFLHPDKAFYIREVERITGEDHQNVSRELQNLEGIGLLISHRQGNLRYFHLNRQFVLYNELRSMYLKTRGVAAVLKETLMRIDDIKISFIYGSFAAGAESEKSDIDLMIIGKLPLEDLLQRIREPEKILGREIQVSLYNLSEIITRLSQKDPFITEVLKNPKIVLTGNEDGLRKLTEKWSAQTV